MVKPRYDRQVRVWGEERQQKLENSRVAIVGLGVQGRAIATVAASMGIGNLVLIDGHSGSGRMLESEFEGEFSAATANGLGKLNPDVAVEVYTTCLESRVDQLLLQGCDVIVDATNDVRSKQLVSTFGRTSNVPVLSTSSRWGYTKYMADDGTPATFMPMFAGHSQDVLMAWMTAGVVVEEMKKAVFGEALMTSPVRYQLQQDRFGFPKEECPEPDWALYEQLSICMVGVGGLGNWAGVIAPDFHIGRLDCIDYDTFDITNLPRQPLGYDGVDVLKAAHVAPKLEAMGVASTGYSLKILPGVALPGEYDVLLDFVDNKYTRALNCAQSKRLGIPLLSAGALPDAARWDAHIPYETQCLDCQYDIYAEGRKEEVIRRASCIEEPDPSVVTTNVIGAVGAMLSLFPMMEPEKYGRSFNGVLSYRALGRNRFGRNPVNKACECYGVEPPSLEISDDEVEVHRGT